MKLASATTTTSQGILGTILRRTRIAAIQATPIVKAIGLKVSRIAHKPETLDRKSAGSALPVIPARSFAWLTAITIAIPMVKPSITASGM